MLGVLVWWGVGLRECAGMEEGAGLARQQTG